VAPDLSNVRVSFVLSEAQRERLARDGFVISPGSEKEFFTVYEKARYANVPIFVTSDSLLHVYHLLFDKVLRTAEVGYFIPLLRDLNQALLTRVQDEYQVLQGTGWEEAARRTVAFVGVASKLLDPGVQVPAYAADLVDAELALIEGASGILPSPLFPGLEFGEDYTQYIPRGHYTKSDELRAYFKSMMWYGRMTFRLKTDDPEVGRAETRSALLLAHALRTADVAYRPALDIWADLYNPTVFFVGRSDDLTVLQYGEVIDQVYGPGATVAALADETKLDAFIAEADQLPPPRILGMVISDTDDVEETTKGLRFMGQRFVPDAYGPTSTWRRWERPPTRTTPSRWRPSATGSPPSPSPNGPRRSTIPGSIPSSPYCRFPARATRPLCRPLPGWTNSSRRRWGVGLS
jgi:hypothetical protein